MYYWIAEGEIRRYTKLDYFFKKKFRLKMVSDVGLFINGGDNGMICKI